METARTSAPLSSRQPLVVTGVVLLLWLVQTYLWLARRNPLFLDQTLRYAIEWIVAAATTAVCVYWIARFRHHPTLTQLMVATAVFLPLWQVSVFVADFVMLSHVRAFLVFCGQSVAFLGGLAWLTWGLERAARRYRPASASELPAAEEPVAAKPTLQRTVKGRRKSTSTARRFWNPLNPAAWYYGQGQRLNQSVSAVTVYSMAFFIIVLLLSNLQGCQELYEMPAGGGQQQQVAQRVQVQKVKKKKYVINPFSAILFNPPPITEVQLQLEEVTAHQYAVGYGQGDSAGYAGGTRRGKVRFLRLEYSGPGWNEDMGIGGDFNLLVKYHEYTSQKIADETESRTVAQLKNFPLGASPPVVYLTGRGALNFSKNEIEILREYLLTQHGMLFADNGGGNFHQHFLTLMNAVLPQVRPVQIPLDDVIHRIPFKLPFLPFVVPHGGKEALGWKVDGRWVAYYHPGDIGDAWADGHAGVKPEIATYCYQLGTNVVNYAHSEYAKWLESRTKK